LSSFEDKAASSLKWCDNCGADELSNLKRHQKSCLKAHDKGVRYYLASLTGDSTGIADNNINDEKVVAGWSI
jgi:hypothetical protein